MVRASEGRFGLSAVFFLIVLFPVVPAYAQRAAIPISPDTTYVANNVNNGTFNDYVINLSNGGTRLRVSTSGGTGDADLYVKCGDYPTTAIYDASSLTNLSNNEAAVIANPGATACYISLYAARAFANVNLIATFEEPEIGRAFNFAGLTDPVQSHFRYFWQKVPKTYQAQVATAEGVNPTGDVDLYYRYGGLPTTPMGSYDCKSATTRSNELCSLGNIIKNGAPHNYLGENGFTGLYAYQAYTGVNLTSDSVTDVIVGNGASTWFQLPIPFGARNVTVAQSDYGVPSGDCDLSTYIGSRNTFVSGSASGSNVEFVNWGSSVYRAGKAFVQINGYLGCPNGVNLKASYDLIRDDLNANGKADLVMQNPANGDVAIWLMNGPAVVEGRLAADAGVPGTAYTVVAHGDFNRNWTSELVLRASDGRLIFWTMNGTVATAGYTLAGPASYTVRGVGDFNGDGNSDLVLGNPATGDLAIWLLNGSMPPSILPGSAVFATLPGWTVAGVGDFDADGKSDLLLYNAASSTAVIWLMDGVTIRDGRPLGTPAGWVPKAVGDMDANNFSDILLQSSTGEVAVWLMEGMNLRMGVATGSAGSYVVKAVADYDGDGMSDVVLQDGAGNIVIWLLDGGNIKAGSRLVANPGAFRVAMQP